MKKQEVINDIRQGRQEALAEIYRSHLEEFKSFVIKKYALDADSAREFFIDALIEFRNNVVNGRLHELNSSIKTYVFAIGKNKIRYYQRDNKISYQIQFDEELEDNNDINLEIEKEEELKAFRIAFDKISESCKELLKMYYYAALSTKEIMQELNYLNEETVRTRKYKCTQRLRKILEEMNLY